jgi:hypothetical protein
VVAYFSSYVTFETENLRLDLLELTNNLHGCFNSSYLHIVSCVFSSAVPVNANNGQSIVKKNNGWTIRYLIGEGGCVNPLRNIGQNNYDSKKY